MRWRAHRSALCALAIALVATACGDAGPSREDTLAKLADTTITPQYEHVVESFSGLETSLTNLCSDPTVATLDEAHAALSAARFDWSVSQAMWVGPVMERRSWATIDWPINEAQIEELIADDTIELDEERLARRIGSDQRGLGAVEYVIGASNTIDVLSGRRCQYLTGIAGVITQEASVLPDDWATSWEDGDPYREVFSATDGEGLDSIINDSVFLLEAMTDRELANALGVMESPADITAIPEGSLGLGAKDLAGHLEGLRLVLVGDAAVEADAKSEGISALLSDDLSSRLNTQFDEATAAVDALSSPTGDVPLRDSVIDSPSSVAAARDALKEIQVTLSTEIVAQLGVTIGFSDADGDSG